MGSQYSDYQKMAHIYDVTRVPVGLEFIRNFLRADYHVLDAGCGTGNYIKKLLPYVNKITGLDYNENMLSRAKQKLETEIQSEKVEIIQGSLLERLPFDDVTFDVVLLNQVLHHLDTDVIEFPKCQQLIFELHRILKPSGVLCVNTCDPDQMSGFWFMDLIPRVKTTFQSRYIHFKTLGRFVLEAGFDNKIRAISFPETLQGLQYFNLVGPLDVAWRLGDSKWQMATQEEIQEAQTKIIELLKEGKLGAYFDEKDKFRREKGQTTFIVAQKTIHVKVI